MVRSGRKNWENRDVRQTCSPCAAYNAETESVGKGIVKVQKRIDEYIKNAAVASAVAVTCIGITGCGSKVEKITDYMDNADYEKALEVYSGWKNVSEEEKEKLADAMRERLEQAAAGFGAGTMELEQAMEIY